MEDEFYVSTDIMKQKCQTCCVCYSNFLCLDHIWLLTALYKLFFIMWQWSASGIVRSYGIWHLCHWKSLI